MQQLATSKPRGNTRTGPALPKYLSPEEATFGSLNNLLIDRLRRMIHYNSALQGRISTGGHGHQLENLGPTSL